MEFVLEKNHLLGWKSYPIKLYDKKGDEILDYQGFSIIGHCSKINYVHSNIIKKRLVPNGPLCSYYKGVHIENWDGSDFFSPEGSYEIIVSKKTANILINNKITNMKLTDLFEYETSIDNIAN